MFSCSNGPVCLDIHELAGVRRKVIYERRNSCSVFLVASYRYKELYVMLVVQERCVCVYVQEKKKDGNVMQERLERTFSFLSLRSQIKAFPWDVVCAAVTLRPNSIRTYFSLVAEMCFSQGRT